MDFGFGKELINVKSMFDSHIDKLEMNTARSYLDIDNKYLLSKIGLILYPFRYSELFNKIDLYIPLMSIISLNLYKVMFYKSFDVSSSIFNRIVVVQFIFSLIYKFLVFAYKIEIGFLEMFAYTSYKYFIILLNLMLTHKNLWFVKLYLYVSFFFFLSRSLKRSMADKQVYLLFCIVGMEVILIFMHSY